MFGWVFYYYYLVDLYASVSTLRTNGCIISMHTSSHVYIVGVKPVMVKKGGRATRVGVVVLMFTTKLLFHSIRLEVFTIFICCISSSL